MCYATPVQPKIGTDKIVQRYTYSTWSCYALRKGFQRFAPAQPEIFTKISLYTTLAQPEFYYISKIWFQILHLHGLKSFLTIWLYITLAQPGFHEICTTWFQGSCTTWNLCLYGKVIYFTLPSHTLIFITFPKHDFRGFFILVVCMFSYIYIFRTYIYV